MEDQAPIDGHEIVRGGGPVADADAAPVRLDEEARPRSVAELGRRGVDGDVGQHGAREGVGDRGPHDGRMLAGLRRRREVHPVAAAARGEVRAGRLHAVGAGRDDPDEVARSWPAAGVHLDLASVARRGARHEDHLAPGEPAHPRPAGGEALDLNGRPLRGLGKSLHFIEIFWAETCPETTTTLTTLESLPFFSVIR